MPRPHRQVHATCLSTVALASNISSSRCRKDIPRAVRWTPFHLSGTPVRDHQSMKDDHVLGVPVFFSVPMSIPFSISDPFEAFLKSSSRISRTPLVCRVLFRLRTTGKPDGEHAMCSDIRRRTRIDRQSAIFPGFPNPLKLCRSVGPVNEVSLANMLNPAHRRKHSENDLHMLSSKKGSLRTP